MTIRLGDRVTDSISGFTGIATGRCLYLTSSTTICITPEILSNCLPVESKWFDEGRVKLHEEPKTTGFAVKKETKERET